MKKVILGLTVLSALAACNSSSIDGDVTPKEGEVVSKLVASERSPEEIAADQRRLKEQKEKEAQERLANQTTMDFNERIHDFGKVDPETEVSYTFKVMNTGDKPLVIEEAKASCGCTVPKKPTEPIAPGEEGELQVSFKSKPGQFGPQNKSVTVTANVPEKQVILRITADVMKPMVAQ
ncbi:DUF1573 domain-containing protein [Lishizhenia sp.]|uniref:DUF1573 domain-containing protein n=1 Tax=Lishizhenia sp. TaxID=2497594 RepID=UPI00299E046D|nr:DUF1573 domain-containing protein [Lishizhenia sp.]MDX1446156.1 DUF1573 domain-containing protein [Lishizhenia sp.]